MDRIAVVTSSLTLRRISAGFFPFVSDELVFTPIEINQPAHYVIKKINEWNCSGIITEYDPELTESLFALNKPTVIINSDLILEGMGQVSIDEEQVGIHVAEYLENLGCKHFGFYGKQLDLHPAMKIGFEEHLLTQKKKVHLIEEAGSFEKNTETWIKPSSVLKTWLDGLPKPIGIFAAHDPLGLVLVEACREAEFDIPDEVVIVCGNYEESLCCLSSPQLSGVVIPWENMAEKATQLVVDVINGASFSIDPILISPREIITRRSSNMFITKNPHIAEAIRYIRGHAHENINVDDVLDQVPINRRALERGFKNEFNRTPKQEITRTKIEKAKGFLLTTDMSLSAISDYCGFTRPEKFSATFKKIVGVTPYRFRLNQNK